MNLTTRTKIAGIAAAAATAVPLLASGAAQADAPPQTFGSTGAEQTYTVPAGVDSINASLTGGTGGSGCHYGSGSGGAGATVFATIPVTGGEKLYVNVAQNGQQGQSAPFGGGGASQGFFGGSGGGASDIRTASGYLSSRLLVAGGGGGCGYGGGVTGADAGAAGLPGTNGQDAIGSPSAFIHLDGQPGGGATQTAGGIGGSSSDGGAGDAGSFGQGGQGGSDGLYTGGGGGGGYYGGGGGDSIRGGGGGSSYTEPAATHATASLDTTATPQITITPGPTLISASASQLTFPDTPNQGVSASQAITITNNSTGSETITGVDFDYSNGQNGDDYLVSGNTCGGQLAAGASCTVRVRFIPQETGASQSALLINALDSSDNSLGTTTVALSGNGTGLPQGPAGPQGPQGDTGATGVAGYAGRHRRDRRAGYAGRHRRARRPAGRHRRDRRAGTAGRHRRDRRAGYAGRHRRDRRAGYAGRHRRDRRAGYAGRHRRDRRAGSAGRHRWHRSDRRAGGSGPDWRDRAAGSGRQARCRGASHAHQPHAERRPDDPDHREAYPGKAELRAEPLRDGDARATAPRARPLADGRHQAGHARQRAAQRAPQRYLRRSHTDCRPLPRGRTGEVGRQALSSGLEHADRSGRPHPLKPKQHTPQSRRPGHTTGASCSPRTTIEQAT